ncbi:hypothetical protein INT45_008279 [Circinella minor]|uniref:Uncharacterized protein n=1 Tax=Circinella minor TaxID=1195481 RepID=A0A8H7RG37_9FUNG|nr:hypothetical protein INT45_008279 [Circinella minor]
MTHQTFPKLSFDQLCLSRSQGGVQLIDPQLQQHALSLRWLIPVLYYPIVQTTSHNGHHNDLFPSNDIIVPYIAHHLLYSNSTLSDHRLLFVFPESRSPSWKQRPELFSHILFSAFDRTSIQMDQLVISPRLALQLLVSSTVQPQGNFTYTEITAQHSTLHKIKTANIYIFDTNLNYLRPRFPTDGQRQYP